MTNPTEGISQSADLDAYRAGLANIDIRLASGQLTPEETTSVQTYRDEIQASYDAALAKWEAGQVGG